MFSGTWRCTTVHQQQHDVCTTPHYPGTHPPRHCTVYGYTARSPVSQWCHSGWVSSPGFFWLLRELRKHAHLGTTENQEKTLKLTVSCVLMYALRRLNVKCLTLLSKCLNSLKFMKIEQKRCREVVNFVIFFIKTVGATSQIFEWSPSEQHFSDTVRKPLEIMKFQTFSWNNGSKHLWNSLFCLKFTVSKMTTIFSHGTLGGGLAKFCPFLSVLSNFTKLHVFGVFSVFINHPVSIKHTLSQA